MQDAAALGLGFGATTPAETELAELVTDRVRVAGVDGSPDRRPIEKLRLVSTGTEATMTAIRLARGFTGRDLLVKFAGHYHGHSDSLLAEAGSGVATLALPGSAGIPEAIAAQTIVVPYNDLDAVRAVIAEHGPRIAAVITEAAAANMGVVPPLPGFTAELARIAHDNGSSSSPTRSSRASACTRPATGASTTPASRPTTPTPGRPTSSRTARSSAAACPSPRSAAGPT